MTKYIEELSKIYDEMYQDSVEIDIYSDVMQDIDNALQKLSDIMTKTRGKDND